MKLAGTFLAAAFSALAERIAPAPEVKPWPYAMGVLSLIGTAMAADLGKHARRHEEQRVLSAWENEGGAP